MRRNALTLTLPAYAILLVLVLLSAVGRADEKQRPPGTVASLLASIIDVPAESGSAPVAKQPSRPRKILMEVTAYCPCKKCCGKNARGVTASGFHVSHNDGLFVAADTTLLPFHTKLLIPGYGDGKAVPVLDRGGAIKGNRLDVFFPTHEQALKWGRRRVEVTVIP